MTKFCYAHSKTIEDSGREKRHFSTTQGSQILKGKLNPVHWTLTQVTLHCGLLSRRHGSLDNVKVSSNWTLTLLEMKTSWDHVEMNRACVHMCTDKYRTMVGPHRAQVLIELSSICSHGQRYCFKGLSCPEKVPVWGGGVNAWLTCGSQRKSQMTFC